MFISIVIPTLNEEENLVRLLTSIEKQNFKDRKEIIVADAGSKDKTREVALSFGCKVVEGGLPAVGRNKGAEIAQGEILAFLDADLILSADFFEKSLREFRKRKLDVASFCLRPETEKIFAKLAIEIFYNKLIVLFEKFLAHGAMAIFVKKDIFDKVGQKNKAGGGFDQEIKMAEDHYFVRQAFKLGRFGIIRSVRIGADMRRFEKDGYFSTFLKYFLCYLYMLSGRPVKSNIFNYKFNHYKKKN
jgi:glycosyltransferase involved in cell wall biosynthesis